MSNIIQFTQNPGQGFYSCCTVLLDNIIKYFNDNKRLPLDINNINVFIKYNPNLSKDITHIYFNIPNSPVIEYIDIIQHSESAQFEPFEHIRYSQIKPFINLYFSPSNTIKEIINLMELKYSIDYDNTCVMFYRGLDKFTETALPRYDEHLKEANKIKKIESELRFLIQTDETEYLHYMLEHLDNSFNFEEIRHANKQQILVDDVCTKEINFIFSQYFLAIVYIMAKCKYVVCNSGNISSWICYFRGNNKNVFQYLDTKFI
jgi:hypothetical protein